MSDYPMLISNKLHSFRNFLLQSYLFIRHQSNFKKLKFNILKNHPFFVFSLLLFILVVN